jgi:hypothetical protein
MTRWLCSCILAVLLAAVTFAFDDPGTPVVVDGLKSMAPAAWKMEQPKIDSRKAQFKIARVAGDPEDADIIVSYFGKGSGGGVDANIKRWREQFKAPAGEKAKQDKFKVGDVEVTYFDISGTYLSKFPPFDPNAKVTEKPNFLAINAIFASPSGPYFFRLVRPAKTVESQKKAFDEWLKNFK